MGDRGFLKVLWEKEKCYLPGFSTFPTMFYYFFQRLIPKIQSDLYLQFCQSGGVYNFVVLEIFQIYSTIIGTNKSFCIKFLDFVSFPVFVNHTIMCQYLRQEIELKRIFEVDKNIFILKPEPIQYLKKKKSISSLSEHLHLSLY